MSRVLTAAVAVGLAFVPGVATADPVRTRLEGAGHGGGSGHRAPTVLSDVTLPAPALAAFQNAVLPGTIADDRGVRLGGVGSGLHPAGRGEFWMVTDRGPNGEPVVAGEKRRTFPLPGFTPAIVRVRVRHGEAEIVRALPLVGSDGRAVTGLSNQRDHDEKPYTWDGQTELPYNAAGLDTEDIVRTGRGEFWLVDEYSPSLVRVSATGRVLERHVPRGLGLTGANYPVRETLPAILATRRQNRGFEGLALSGRTLYAAVQSPLANPDTKTGKSSRLARIIAFDLRTGTVTGEYGYRFEKAGTFDPDAEQSDMKISGLVALGGRRLLVEERTDAVARLYTVDLAKARNLLGGKYDDPATTPSLEADPAAPAAPKTLAVDLAAIPGLPGKIEGVTLTNSRTLVIANDNDFGLGTFGPDGRLIDSGVPNRLITIRLPRPLH